VERRSAAGPVLVTALLLTAGCGGGHSGSQDPDAGGLSAAADTSTCLKDATAVTSTPDDFPASFPFPSGTVMFHVEDRGAEGVIATGVSASPFAKVLAAMNDSKSAGFRITSGETEKDDAEANWTGNGFTGRWAIKKSATCPGETVIQLLSKRGR
jgi:hypothetical protein